MDAAPFRLLVVTLSLLVFPYPAAAQQDLRYDYVQLSHSTINMDNLALEFSGMRANASRSLGDRFYLFGAYSGGTTGRFEFLLRDGELEGTGRISLDSMSAGVGIRFDLDEQVDVVAGVAFERLTTRHRDELGVLDPVHSHGYVAMVGMRYLLVPILEMDSGISYSSASSAFMPLDERRRLNFGFIAHITQSLSADLSYNEGRRSGRFNIGVRYNF